MVYHLHRLTTSLAPVLCCLFATALATKAVAGADEDGWRFSGAAYLWAAGIEGTSAAGDDIDISFTDVAEDLAYRQHKPPFFQSREVQETQRQAKKALETAHLTAKYR